MDDRLEHEDAYRFDDGEFAVADEDPPSRELRLEQIHRDHFAFVWRTLCHLGVPNEAVEDAVQDVFLVAYRRLDEFEGRSSMRTWLFAIARRIAYRHRRTATRRRRKLDALADAERSAANLETDLARAEARRILAGFLDSLDDAKREVFVLHTLEGVSGREIASTLGVSVNTVHSRLRLARRRFETMCRVHHVAQDGALAQARTEPPTRARRHAWAALAPMLELPREGLVAGATSSWTLAAQAKLFAVTVALGGVGLGAVRVSDVDRPALIPTAAAASTVPDARSHSPRSPTPATAAIAPNVSVAAPALPTPEPVPSVAERPPSPLALEVRTMKQLRAFINRGDAARALALIERADGERRGGVFEVERAAYRAIALCALGRVREGRGVARLFLRDHPGAPLAGRVRRDCLGAGH